MTKIRFWCRDCGEPLERNTELCPQCNRDRIKERQKQERRRNHVT